MDREVRLFDGTKARIVCDDSEIRDTVYRIMVEPFTADLEEGWLAKGARALVAENHVKKYLDYVGYLMITTPDKYGVLGKQKLEEIQSNEMLVESADGVRSHKSPPSVRRVKHTRTAFERYDLLYKLYPGSILSFTTVDTDGRFDYNGKSYVVTDHRYDAEVIAGWGDYYSMDRIWVLRDKATGRMDFFDQNMMPIDPKYINAWKERPNG